MASQVSSSHGDIGIQPKEGKLGKILFLCVSKKIEGKSTRRRDNCGERTHSRRGEGGVTVKLFRWRGKNEG